MAKVFSATEAIKFGWGVAKSQWRLFLGIFAIQALVNYLPQGSVYLGSQIHNNFFIILGGLLSVVSMIVGFVIVVGMLRIQLSLTDGKKAQIADLFVKDISLLFKFFLTSVLMGLIIVAGFILFIVPGIYLALRLILSPFYVVDKSYSPLQAIKASWAATKGNVTELLKLWVLQLLVVLVGFLALVVGLALAVPTALIASAYVYRKLSTST